MSKYLSGCFGRRSIRAGKMKVESRHANVRYGWEMDLLLFYDPPLRLIGHLFAPRSSGKRSVR